MRFFCEKTLHFQTFGYGLSLTYELTFTPKGKQA